ncbi:MAG TPA: Ig-like domain-containing protein [Thermoanaerobaculia bacterium]|nr:Ig-like domain-containing protein [Thermoanaerobaculia bacterium]
MRLLARIAAVLLLFVSPVIAAEYDDCDANFIAFIGSSAYQFSPSHEGELGAVRLYSILSYQRAAVAKRFGFAVWRLDIADESGAIVTAVNGRARIGTDGAALAEFWWDGRDDAGRLVPAGRYRYTFLARYVGDFDVRPLVMDYDTIAAKPRDEALASSDDVIVNYDLTQNAARNLRMTANATSCQVQQHAPLEAGFGYNFYYGSTHAHSNWSDGGQPTTNCSSGNAYGSGTFAPSDVFAYARDTAQLDYWVVNEHNHLIQDAIATNNPPVTEAKVRQRYQDGLAAANAVTSSGTFVGVYGMEWGVTTNADEGHVTLLETPTLFGWETCSTCNGPSAECTPGTNCYFDVFTPKRYGYLTLYQRSVEHPSTAGALGVFNHPDSTNFDNFAFNANADNAMQGIAVRSGLAFTTATNCGTANVGSTDYTTQWKSALNKGFHLAPTADHDSHCNNYGMALPTRTVYLLPNATSPALTKANLLAAHRARHFYATEDPNAQMVFRTGDGAHIMGDIFTAAGGTTLVAHLYDPDGESTSTLEVWRGQIGGGVPAAPYASWSNSASGTVNESLTSGTYYYYVHAVQADGHDVWSAPMWITYSAGGGGDVTAPVTSISAPLNGATVGGTTSVTASATDNIGVTKVEFYLDGALKSTDTATPFAWSWDTTGASNGTHTLQTKAYDAATNVGTSASVTVTVSNGVAINIGGYTLTQANATLTYTIPSGTTIPSKGYVIIGRNATKTAFQSFWGVTLASNVVYINSADTMPQINGSETYTLKNASASILDGATVAMASGALESLRRTNGCAAANLSTSWTRAASSTGNPGSGAPAACGKGVYISEFSDAAGTGNYIYEFIELYNDK